MQLEGSKSNSLNQTILGKNMKYRLPDIYLSLGKGLKDYQFREFMVYSLPTTNTPTYTGKQ